MNVEIISQSEESFDEVAVYNHAKSIFVLLDREGVSLPQGAGSLIVVFVDEKRGEELNSQFRKKDHATDVLSFEGVDPESLGELVLCVPVVTKQANQNGHSFELESAYLITHGILHLLGFEHENGGEKEKQMMELQDKIFEEIRS